MAFIEQVQLLVGQATKEGVYLDRRTGKHLTSSAYAGLVGPGTYVAVPGEVALLSEPAHLLQRLYAAAGPDARPLLAPTLLRLLNGRNARVVARTLAATGLVGAFSNIVNLDSATEEAWRGLIHVLRFESPLFDEQDLKTIETTAASLTGMAVIDLHQQLAEAKQQNKRPPPYRLVAVEGSSPVRYEARVEAYDLADEALSVISRIRYLRLAKTLRENQNPAIDADRQVLLSRLQAMGFSQELSHASNEVERRAATVTTETDVKTVMDLLRAFFEEFTEEACHKVAVKVGRAVPSGPKQGHYAPYRQYLESAGVVGYDESELLQKLYNYLSNQGAHRLGTQSEQLRVAHATVVEWCMLIAGRVRAFIS